MSPGQKTLIQETWRQVTPIADEAMSLFYDRLFETDPSLRQLFEGVDLSLQRKLLAQAITSVVEGLESVEDVVPQLEALGRRHSAYGATSRHYEAVGAAFIWTLEQGLGENWTPEAKAAWTAAYTLIATVMQSAAGDDSHSESVGAVSA